MRTKQRHKQDFELVMRDKLPLLPFKTDPTTGQYTVPETRLAWTAYQACLININALLRARHANYEKVGKYLQAQITANIRVTIA